MLDTFIQKEIQKQVSSLKEELRQEFLRELRNIDNPWLSRFEAARYLKVSVSTIDNYVRWNLLPKYKVSRKTTFKRSDLDKMIF